MKRSSIPCLSLAALLTASVAQAASFDAELIGKAELPRDEAALARGTLWIHRPVELHDGSGVVSTGIAGTVTFVNKDGSVRSRFEFAKPGPCDESSESNLRFDHPPAVMQDGTVIAVTSGYDERHVYSKAHASTVLFFDPSGKIKSELKLEGYVSAGPPFALASGLAAASFWAMDQKGESAHSQVFYFAKNGTIAGSTRIAEPLNRNEISVSPSGDRLALMARLEHEQSPTDYFLKIVSGPETPARTVRLRSVVGTPRFVSDRLIATPVLRAGTRGGVSILFHDVSGKLVREANVLASRTFDPHCEITSISQDRIAVDVSTGFRKGQVIFVDVKSARVLGRFKTSYPSAITVSKWGQVAIVSEKELGLFDHNGKKLASYEPASMQLPVTPAAFLDAKTVLLPHGKEVVALDATTAKRLGNACAGISREKTDYGYVCEWMPQALEPLVMRDGTIAWTTVGGQGFGSAIAFLRALGN